MNIFAPEEVGLSSARLERISAVMQGYVDHGKLAGLITLVARRGKVAHFECFGMMDVEVGKPMRPDTIFRIYSMTKPVSSVAFMTLFEEGRFLLNDPVSKFIPEFANLKVFVGANEAGVVVTDLEREITIRDLLTHTAGLGYGLLEDTPVEDMYRAAGFLDGLVRRVSDKELVQRLAKLPLAHQPGRRWRYSLAHDVIAHLISVIADMPFDVFLEDRVFGPLGMVDTGFFVPDDKVDRLAALYHSGGTGDLILFDAPTTSVYLNPDNHPSGGSGLVSTVSDYLRFAHMLLNGGELDDIRLLSRKTVKLMTTNHLSDELIPIHFGPRPVPVFTGYGLGFGVLVGAVQSGILGSEGAFGWGGAAGTYYWVDPREQLIGLMMPQHLRLASQEPVREIFGNLTYKAVID